MKFEQFQGASAGATKANSSKTWNEVCFTSLDVEEICLAHICGLIQLALFLVNIFFSSPCLTPILDIKIYHSYCNFYTCKLMKFVIVKVEH